jgi:hypothetical protein
MWRRAAIRLTGALALASALYLTPLPEDWPARLYYLQVSLAAILVVCALGKLLYDTLFYNRYKP